MISQRLQNLRRSLRWDVSLAMFIALAMFVRLGFDYIALMRCVEPDPSPVELNLPVDDTLPDWVYNTPRKAVTPISPLIKGTVANQRSS